MLIPRALWLLTWLRIKGSIRRALFSGSTRKTIATVVGGVAMALWLLNLVVNGFRRTGASAETIRAFGPALLASICLMPLAFGGASRMLAFAPAEIDQLFPAPFSRRQLVAYRILKVSLGSLFTGVFYTLIFGGSGVSWPVSFVAASLAWVFTGLLTMSFALVEATLAQRAAFLRLVPQGLLIAVVAAAAWQVFGAAHAGDPAARLRAIVEIPVIQALALPFQAFILLFTARTWSEVPVWLGVCLAQVLGLALLTLRLDTAWLDTSVAVTHARARRVEERRGAAGRPPGTFSTRLKRLIPELAFAGPARAIIRRHLAAAPAILLLPLGVIAGLGGVIAALRYGTGINDPSEAIVSLTTTLGAMVLISLPMAVRCDFRADLDHLETLKSVPISPAAITRAELATPSLLLIITLWEILAVAAFHGPRDEYYAAAAILAVPAAVLVMAVENALFLFAPTRQGPAQAATLQVTGKRIITFVAKAIVLALCAGLSGGAALLVHTLGGPVIAAGLAAAVVLAGLAAIAVAAVTTLFRRFDVAVDMPD